MRLSCLAALLLLASSAALAAPPPPQPQIVIPPEMTDPQFIHRLMGMTDALSKAFLELRVGEIQAAAEGRPATPADRNRAVGEIAGPQCDGVTLLFIGRPEQARRQK